MRLRTVISLICATFAAGAVLAETVIVNDQVTVRDSSIPRPKRGMHMTQVERQFGAPTTKHAAVGRPPITRWDYPAFSVFFERDIVIHTVVTGDQPPAAGDHPVASATP
ncbi:MAG TPA: hypothetical protein VMD03_09920 [Steroidobacteraceae bacterium]|nr:hypothetical protein [Steroidobacteraceae bacterium]